MRILLISFISILSIITSIQAVTWSRVYGGSEDDIAYAVKQTPDGGYVVIGSTESFGLDYYNIWILKLDQNGDTAWSKIYDSISNYGEFHDIEIDYNGGYIFGGSYEISGIEYNFICKTDSIGDSVWSKTYNIYDPGCFFSYPLDIDITLDSGYIIAGRVDLGNSMGFILKLDQNGDSSWATVWGENLSYSSVIENFSKNYYVGIWGEHFLNLCLVNFDSLGNQCWSTGYFNGAYAHCVEQTSDSGIVLVTTDPSKLIKIDTAGDTIWTRDYGGYSVIQDNQDNFLIVSNENNDIKLVQTDQNGDSIWARLYGGSSPEVGYSLQPTTDGGYIIAGATESYGSGGYDFYIVKVDSLGYLGVEEEFVQQYPQYPDITIENLSSGQVKISFIQSHAGNLYFSVYDLSGRMIDRPLEGFQEEGECTITLTGYRPGVYFYRLRSGEDEWRGKFRVY